MCGRYTLHSSAAEIAEAFQLDLAELPDLRPRYNIAPTQSVPIVRSAPETGRRELVLARWGLLPSWLKDPSDFPTLINARSETAANKPAFRAAFRERRCLVPADGFFEWQKSPGGKQPYLIRREGDLMGMAGLWERREERDPAKGEPLTMDSFTILTTRAAEEIASLHDRMPVVLRPDDYARWLDLSSDPAELLHPYAGDDLAYTAISRRVNSPRNDDASVLEPAAAS